MDKILIKIRIVILAIVAVFFTTVLINGIYYRKSSGDIFSLLNIENNNYEIKHEENTSIDNCENIMLDFHSSNVIIKSTDEKKLKVVQKATGKINEKEKIIITKEGNNISIKKDQSKRVFFIFGFNLNEKIEVYIPKNYSKNLEINLSSGNVKIESDLTLNNLKSTQSSGNFKGQYHIKANEVILKTTSGNINVEKIDSKNYGFNASSGNISIDSLEGSGNAHATSGNIKIRYKDISDYSNIESTSGNIKIEIPEKISFKFTGKCTSGDIHSDFHMDYESEKKNEAYGKIGSAPYKKINTNTTSGNIDVVKVP